MRLKIHKKGAGHECSRAQERDYQYPDCPTPRNKKELASEFDVTVGTIKATFRLSLLRIQSIQSQSCGGVFMEGITSAHQFADADELET